MSLLCELFVMFGVDPNVLKGFSYPQSYASEPTATTSASDDCHELQFGTYSDNLYCDDFASSLFADVTPEIVAMSSQNCTPTIEHTANHYNGYQKLEMTCTTATASHPNLDWPKELPSTSACSASVGSRSSCTGLLKLTAPAKSVTPVHAPDLDLSSSSRPHTRAYALLAALHRQQQQQQQQELSPPCSPPPPPPPPPPPMKTTTSSSGNHTETSAMSGNSNNHKALRVLCETKPNKLKNVVVPVGRRATRTKPKAPKSSLSTNHVPRAGVARIRSSPNRWTPVCDAE
jgi:hypothetical protein